MIELSDVSKQFQNKPILNGASFSVKAGETVVLMGPSGCGKTTVLRCLNGLEQPDQGRIVVDTSCITPPPSGFNWQTYRAKVGLVFQQFNLFPHLTVLQNMTLAPVQVKKIPRPQAEAHALDLLAQVDLEDMAHRYPQTLSGGEKQRVAIARALAMDPQILLLDEPTSALDPMMTAEVLKVIQNLAQQGLTMVIVTHELPFALRVADRLLLMNEGQIVLDTPPQQLAQHTHNPMVKSYLDTLHYEFGALLAIPNPNNAKS